MACCKLHPSAVCDPRFEFLNSLIACGWGNVPMAKIEAAMERNGGVLPAAPSPVDYATDHIEPEEDDAPPPRRAYTPGAKAATLDAVERGYQTAFDIAAETGLKLHSVSSYLSALRKERKVAIIDERRGPTNQVIYVYSAVRP